MQRRNFLIGAAGTAIGGSALVGSGAFTSVEADRDIDVEVAGDANAFLGIEPAGEGNDDYVEGDGTDGTIGLNFDDPEGEDIGNGINDRAQTVFDNLLKITNQGTQDLHLGIRFVDENGDPVEVRPNQVSVGGPILATEPVGETTDLDRDGGPNYDWDPSEDGTSLSPGQSINMGVYFTIEEGDSLENITNDLETMVIAAEAV